MAKRSAVKQLNNVHPVSSDDDNEEPKEFRQASEEVLRTRKIKPLKKKGSGFSSAPFNYGLQVGSDGGLRAQASSSTIPDSTPMEDKSHSSNNVHLIAQLKGLNASFVAMLQKYPVEDYSTVCQEYIRYRKEIIDEFSSKNEASKPTYSFGNSSGENVGATQSVKVSTTTFNFGSVSNQNNSNLDLRAVLDSGTANFGTSSNNSNTLVTTSSPAKREVDGSELPLGTAKMPSQAIAADPVASKPSFSFGVQASVGKEATGNKPGFSFGVTSVPSATLIPSTQQSFKPLFGFQNNDQSQNNEETPAQMATSTESNPSTTGFSFGTSLGEKGKDSTQKQVFAFSTKVESANALQTPKLPSLFTFGKSESPKKEDPQPTFTFGSKPSPTKDTSEPAFSVRGTENPGESAKPNFVFGSVTQPSKPAFTFGSKPTKDTSEPAVSAGGTGNPGESGKPKFEFGSVTQSSKPAFTFGSKPLSPTKTDAQPIFSFGDSSKSNTGSDNREPVFAFGSNPDMSKPTFSFGAKPTSPNQNGSKPAFSFSSAPSSIPNPNQSSTSFAVGDSKSAPKFSFGMSSTTPLSNSLFSGPTSTSKPDGEGDGEGEEEETPPEPQLGSSC
jgi:hypothetical protein